MFTGLVEETGTVVRLSTVGNTAQLTVRADKILSDTAIGDSIAVNGCCLTVIAIDGDLLTFDAIPETLARTDLGCLRPSDRVNIERPLAAGARLGGHFVQGHIDGVGTLRSVTPAENAVILDIEPPRDLMRYIVEKGSIAVDGVSLTVAGVSIDSFTVWTIPHTRAVTTLGDRLPGDAVNLECDVLAKYIEGLLRDRPGIGE